MKRAAIGLGILLIITVGARIAAQGAKYSLKVGEAAPPKELSESIRALLAKQPVLFQNDQGKTLCEIWFRQEVPADATPEQVKNGLSYREIKQSEILGAIRFDEDWYDYRKQKVKAGVYTLRLAYQPQDGDHMGASEFTEFCAIVAADKDTKPDLMDAKHLSEVSAKSVNTGHPGVFMLFPNLKPANAPELAAKPRNHWVVNTKEAVNAKGTKTSIGIGLTVIGAAE